jgi:hypothetical protein
MRAVDSHPDPEPEAADTTEAATAVGVGAPVTSAVCTGIFCLPVQVP